MAVLLIVVAVYLGATQALPENVTGWRYLLKGLGTVMLLWGVAALIGGFVGNRDILNPLPNFAGTSTNNANQAHAGAELFTQVNNIPEFERALGAAQSEGRYVLLDYYADWCVDCKRMEANTFVNPAVKRVLDDRFVLLQVDVTDPNDTDRSALKNCLGFSVRQHPVFRSRR